MDFDIKKVYSAVNADEVKAGSKVILANDMNSLRKKVGSSEDISILDDILPDYYPDRFESIDKLVYSLCYLIEEPEEKKLKWTDLKVGDVIRRKETGITRMVTGIDTSKEASYIEAGFCCIDYDKLGEWEKADE